MGLRLQQCSIYWEESSLLPTWPHWHEQHKHVAELFWFLGKEIHLVLPFKGKSRPDNLRYRNRGSWRNYMWMKCMSSVPRDKDEGHAVITV